MLAYALHEIQPRLLGPILVKYVISAIFTPFALFEYDVRLLSVELFHRWTRLNLDRKKEHGRARFQPSTSELVVAY